jgi:hypothetical protein
MKRYYVEIRVREVDVRIAPDRNTIETLEMHDTHVYVAQISNNAIANGAFQAAVQAAQEITRDSR